MTVPVDGSPKRLLDQSGRAVPVLPSAFRPHGGAEIDALRAMVETVMQERLEAEFTRFIGVAPYDRKVGRGGVRNGTRPRTLMTRVGTLALRVPRDRDALFQLTGFQRYARHEQALIALLAECYLQGARRAKSARWSRRSAARR